MANDITLGPTLDSKETLLIEQTCSRSKEKMFGNDLLYPRVIAACLSILTLRLACFLNFPTVWFLLRTTSTIVLSCILKYF